MYTAYEHDNGITYIVKADDITGLEAIIKIKEALPNGHNVSAKDIVIEHFNFDKMEQSKHKDRVNLIGLISYYNVPKREIVIIPDE